MKAIIYNQTGEYPKLVDKDIPEPKENQVLVKMLGSSLNRRDLWISKGLYSSLNSGTTLGSCGVGVYDGQEVLINPNQNWGDDPEYPNHKEYSILGMPVDGTFADYLVIDKDRIHPKPAHLTTDEAAGMSLGALTAYRALFTKGRAVSKDRIFISGIGGGVALFVFQFALAIGAEVYVSSGSDAKIERAIALGAKGGINYRSENWSKEFKTNHGTVDVIIDSAAGKGYNELLKICNPRARIVNYGGTKGTTSFSPQILFWKELELIGSTMGNDEEFKNMLDLVETCQIRPIIDSVYDFSDSNKAFEKMENYEQFGKIVLKN